MAALKGRPKVNRGSSALQKCSFPPERFFFAANEDPFLDEPLKKISRWWVGVRLEGEGAYRADTGTDAN
jgi:hypothetical protein